MQRAKAFFFVCAGVFLLALSYHFGAMSAGAQAPGNPVVATFGGAPVVVTANGDVYEAVGGDYNSWQRRENVFTGPTASRQESWGQLKARYR